MRLIFLLALVCLKWAATCLAATPAESNSAGEARFLSNIRQLTFQGRRSGEAYCGVMTAGWKVGGGRFRYSALRGAG